MEQKHLFKDAYRKLRVALRHLENPETGVDVDFDPTFGSEFYSCNIAYIIAAEQAAAGSGRAPKGLDEAENALAERLAEIDRKVRASGAEPAPRPWLDRDERSAMAGMARYQRNKKLRKKLRRRYRRKLWEGG